MLNINFNIYKDRAVYSYYSPKLDDCIYRTIDRRDLRKYYNQIDNTITYDEFLHKYDMQIYKHFYYTYAKIIEYIEQERLQKLHPQQTNDFIFDVAGN